MGGDFISTFAQIAGTGSFICNGGLDKEKTKLLVTSHEVCHDCHGYTNQSVSAMLQLLNECQMCIFTYEVCLLRVMRETHSVLIQRQQVYCFGL